MLQARLATAAIIILRRLGEFIVERQNEAVPQRVEMGARMEFLQIPFRHDQFAQCRNCILGACLLLIAIHNTDIGAICHHRVILSQKVCAKC